jgi:hypothetical protein
LSWIWEQNQLRYPMTSAFKDKNIETQKKLFVLVGGKEIEIGVLFLWHSFFSGVI